MQATFDMDARALPRLQLARRGTMMRSEKRRRSAPSPAPGPSAGPERPPRRRKPQRAGAIYIVLTVILLLIAWPIGLIPLWRRRLRWGTATKLFVSVITMMACILLLGAALTVETDSPAITAVQDRAIGYLDSAADALVDFSVDMAGRANESLRALNDIRALYQDEALNRAADAIDRAVELAQGVREWATGLASGTVDVTGESDEATPIPGATSRATAAPGDDESEATPEPTAAPTSAPAAELTVGAQDEELPVYIPEAAPDADAGAPISEGMLLRSGELDPDALPSPTPEAYSFSVKPAGDAIVYFNIGSGRYYHMAPVCGSMKNADEHTLAEAAENIHTPCERCTPPDKSILEEEFVAWVDGNELAHTTDECPAFEGQWSLVAAGDAIDAKYEACPRCQADLYLDALARGAQVTLAPYRAPTETAEPTPSPAPSATPTPKPTLAPASEAAQGASAEPTVRAITPRQTLRPASEIMVYHSSNGQYYHTNDHCSGMTGGKLYSLADCVADGFAQCEVCGAPPAEALDAPYLWQDEDGICHTSDECEAFRGDYVLVDRETALEARMKACARCGAADYLVPGTELSLPAPASN